MSQRILVVDDEVEMTSLISFNLGRAGYSVTTAHDGNEAFEKARMMLPDAVVMDLRMPELDGLTVCRLLRDTPSTRNIPVFIITAHGSEQVRAESLRCGAVDYMSKPFSPRELVRRLQVAIDDSVAHADD